MTTVLTVTEENFRQEVEECPIPVLLDFWSQNCGFCPPLIPILDQLAEEYDGQARIAKIDAGNEPALATKFGIRGVPTLVMMKDGEMVEKTTGATAKKFLASWLDAHTGGNSSLEQVYLDNLDDDEMRKGFIKEGSLEALLAALESNAEILMKPIQLMGRGDPVSVLSYCLMDNNLDVGRANLFLQHTADPTLAEVAGAGTLDALRQRCAEDVSDEHLVEAVGVCLKQSKKDNLEFLVDTPLMTKFLSASDEESINRKGQLFLQGIMHKHIDFLVLLAGYDAPDVLDPANCFLIAAAITGNLEATTFLVERGYNPNAKDPSGQTPRSYLMEKISGGTTPNPDLEKIDAYLEEKEKLLTEAG